ncbi:MAG: hypothetical protein DHS20C21_23100 [Gemmatimonadota bacterium]|nr:MAG: hypothetical protein DHS20C21_23100 [Gemmatimonadota bacterium]
MSFPTTLPTWGIIVVIGAGTFLLRLSFVHWWAHRNVSPRLVRLLRLVPAAVLCALVVPAVAFRELPPDLASGGGTLANPRLLAAVIAALVAAGTRNVLVTIAVGMLALWGFQLVL